MTETETAQHLPPHMASLSEEQLQNLMHIEEEVQLKAAQLGLLHGEYHVNISRILCHYEPMMSPLESIIFSGREKQKLLETQIIWLERVIVIQERRGGSTTIPLIEMRRIEEDLLQPKIKALNASYHQLEIVTRDELAILRDYDCPPAVAIAVMEMAMRVRGDEETDWPAVRVVLSESYFFQFFISRLQTIMRQPMSDELLNDLEHFCASPEHSPNALREISVPLGAIGMWLYAARDYYRVKRIMRLPETPLGVEDRRQELTKLRHELQMVKENMQSAEDKLKKLKKEAARRVVEVRHEYDDTMCPLEDVLEKKTANFFKVLSGGAGYEITEEEEENFDDIKE